MTTYQERAYAYCVQKIEESRSFTKFEQDAVLAFAQFLDSAKSPVEKVGELPPLIATRGRRGPVSVNWNSMMFRDKLNSLIRVVNQLTNNQ